MTWTEGKLQLLTCYVEIHCADQYISKHEYMLCNVMCLLFIGLLNIGPLHWQKMHIWPDDLPFLTDILTCLLL